MTLILPRDDFESSDAIMEFRPGVGGTESALFADDLVTLYTKFAAL